MQVGNLVRHTALKQSGRLRVLTPEGMAWVEFGETSLGRALPPRCRLVPLTTLEAIPFKWRAVQYWRDGETPDNPQTHEVFGSDIEAYQAHWPQGVNVLTDWDWDGEEEIPRAYGIMAVGYGDTEAEALDAMYAAWTTYEVAG